jgi:hypothetical protein
MGEQEDHSKDKAGQSKYLERDLLHAIEGCSERLFHQLRKMQISDTSGKWICEAVQPMHRYKYSQVTE